MERHTETDRTSFISMKYTSAARENERTGGMCATQKCRCSPWRIPMAREHTTITGARAALPLASNYNVRVCARARERKIERVGKGAKCERSDILTQRKTLNRDAL